MSIKTNLHKLSQRILTAQREANITALRIFLRVVPAENHRVIALTLLVGAVCGLAAVLFHMAILGAEHRLIERVIALQSPANIWLLILTPTIGGLVCGLLLQYVVPGARGSGVPQVKVAYAVKGGRVPFIDALGKFAIGVLQIGSGSSLGREGPTVQICAGIASTFGKGAALSRENLRRLLPVGAAAGIAAAFNAPIAAVTFTIEEVVGDLDQSVLSWIVVAAAISAGVERSILGEHPVFTVTAHAGLDHASSLLIYAVLGIAAAGVSLIFTESLLRLRKWFRGLTLIPVWVQPGVGGLVTGVLAAIAITWLNTGGITGGGYGTLNAALAGNLAIRTLIILCAFKLVATVFSYSSGGAGGIFAPALFIGGMLGGLFGYADRALLNHATPELGAFALVGMGAVFAGIIRAPITSVLIIFEMTGSYELILPLMISNMTAYGIARHFRHIPIYEALLEQDGIHLPHQRRHITHALDRLQVSDAMTTDLVVLRHDTTVADALEQVRQFNFSTYPVLGEHDRFLGLITEARLRRTFAEDGKNHKVAQLIYQSGHVFPDQALVRAAIRMDEAKVRQMPVVERVNGNRLVGLLTMTDIIEAQARAAKDAGETDRTVVPEFAEETETLKQ